MKRIILISIALILIMLSPGFSLSSHFDVTLESNDILENKVTGVITTIGDSPVVTYKCLNSSETKIITLGEINKKESNEFSIDFNESLAEGDYKIVFAYDGQKIEKIVKKQKDFLKVKLNKKTYNPQQSIVLTGEVTDQENELVTVKVTNKAKNQLITVDQVKIKDGSFTFHWKMPETASAGTYACNVKVGDSNKTLEFTLESKINKVLGKKAYTIEENNKVKLPKQVKVKLVSGEIVQKPVQWPKKEYRFTSKGRYTIEGIIDSVQKYSVLIIVKGEKKKATNDKSEEEVSSKETSVNQSANKKAKDAQVIIDQMIKDETLASEELSELTREMIESDLSKVVKDKKVSRRQKAEFKKKVYKLIERSIVKSARVRLDSKGTIDQKQLKDAIKKAKAVSKKLKASLENTDASEAIDKIEDKITIEVEQQLEDVSLAYDVIKALKQNEMGVLIKSDKAEIDLSRDNLKELENKTLEVKSSTAPDEVNSHLNRKAGNTYTFIKTNDIEVMAVDENGNSAQVKDINIKFDISDYDGNSDVLSLLVYDNLADEFELLPSWVDGNKLASKAPHYSYYTIAETNVSYQDIENHWAKDTVIKMTSKGIVNGRSKVTFDPEGDITRAEFVKMLIQAFGINEEFTTTFTDTERDQWYYEPVNMALNVGVVSGVGNGEFLPNRKITREDMVVMMANFYAYAEGEPLASEEILFDDMENASAYSKEAINGAASVEIVRGYEGGEFKPQAYATRAEALEMLKNLLSYLR